jgi:molecular chaperone DnaK
MSERGAVVGIDLGTSNTVVAHADAAQGPRALVESLSTGALLPSVIAFAPSKAVLVGGPAKQRRFLDPKNTIYGVKRLIGRPWGSPEVEEARRRMPFELRRGKNDAVQILSRGELYGLPEISAFVLRKAKAIAEGALERPVTRAVITVPANFNDLQREATKLAGKLAGLDVLRILNEPTAAALAYGHGRPLAERLLVYDFGGGTFDVTLLRASEGVFRVVATAGDTFLGGDDVDLAIAEKIAEAFLRRHHYDLRANRETFAEVRIAAERIKVALASEPKASLDLDGLVHGEGGRGLQFRYTMTRRELSLLVDPFVMRTLAVCETALSRAGWTHDDVQELLLVGGSTRLGQVRERIAERFRCPTALDLNPDEAVALGAALHAIGFETGTGARKPLDLPFAPPIGHSPGGKAPVPSPPAGIHAGRSLPMPPMARPPAGPPPGFAPPRRGRSRPPPGAWWARPRWLPWRTCGSSHGYHGRSARERCSSSSRRSSPSPRTSRGRSSCMWTSMAPSWSTTRRPDKRPGHLADTPKSVRDTSRCASIVRKSRESLRSKKDDACARGLQLPRDGTMNAHAAPPAR